MSGGAWTTQKNMQTGLAKEGNSDGSGPSKHDAGPSLHPGGRKIQPGLCGLNNLGNTGYLNCIIQCLSNVPMLTKYFLDEKYKSDLNCTSPLGAKGEIAKAYAALLKKMWSGVYISLRPVIFKREVGRFAPQFSGSQQQSAFELITFLLDGIHEDLNRIRQRPSYIEPMDSDGRTDADVADEFWTIHLSRNDSIIVDLFHGQFRSKFVCPKCDRVSVYYEPFNRLPLPLPAPKESTTEGSKPSQQFSSDVLVNLPGDPTNIQECFTRFLSVKLLEVDDSWYCPSCREHVQATSKMDLWKLPSMLVIELQRHMFTNARFKRDNFVDYPIRGLDLMEHIPVCKKEDESWKYDLVAVVNHRIIPAGGHYATYAKHAPTNKWYYFDDAAVSPVTEDKVVSKDAYLLFYVQQDCMEGLTQQMGSVKLVKDHKK